MHRAEKSRVDVEGERGRLREHTWFPVMVNRVDSKCTQSEEVEPGALQQPHLQPSSFHSVFPCVWYSTSLGPILQRDAWVWCLAESRSETHTFMMNIVVCNMCRLWHMVLFPKLVHPHLLYSIAMHFCKELHTRV